MTVQRPVVMIVDDEPGILEVLSRFADRAGFDALTCARGRDAIEHIRQRRPDLVMVDLRMPDIGGLDVLRAIREIDPHCGAVLMTGYAGVETAVEAIKLGAIDYLTKPLDFSRVDQLLSGVRDEAERRRSVLSIEGDLARRLEFCGMIGRGPRMQDLFGMIRRLAPHVKTALITGETGTGKELAARALHRLGPRRDRRFVTVTCSSGAEAPLERELFGYGRGAFPGALEDRPGLFEAAEGGTLFLDEVGDLPPIAQSKLLRALEVGEIHRLGSFETRPVDVHVIATTSRDLRGEVGAGRFRSDLFYRLTSIEIRLPALRDRREDIPYLTAGFVRETADRLGKTLPGLTAGAEALLTAAPWDGNIRELRHVIERACIMADGQFVTERELALSMPNSRLRAVEAAEALEPSAVGGDLERDLLTTVERDHIQRALVRTNGNKKAAAQMLGLSRRALYRRLERLDLSDTIARRRQDDLLEV